MPHYWVADPETQTVAQYTLRSGSYGPPKLLRGDDRVQSVLFPELDVPVSGIFARVRGTGRAGMDLARFALSSEGATPR